MTPFKRMTLSEIKARYGVQAVDSNTPDVCVEVVPPPIFLPHDIEELMTNHTASLPEPEEFAQKVAAVIHRFMWEECGTRIADEEAGSCAVEVFDAACKPFYDRIAELEGRWKEWTDAHVARIDQLLRDLAAIEAYLRSPNREWDRGEFEEVVLDMVRAAQRGDTE